MATVRAGDFEWDSRKAEANAKKHGVTFEEAMTVFDDPNAIDAPDLYDHERFVIVGRSGRDRVLFVVHALLHHDRIRLITARKASPTQREAYDRRAAR